MKVDFTKHKSAGFYLFLLLLALGLPIQRSVAQFVTYSFTPCGAVGQFGPNAGQASGAYGPTNLNGLVTIIGQGVQQWVVPATGLYGFTAAGAAGGGVVNSFGCRGRIVHGEITLTAGQVLSIIVGQRGTFVNASAGGGGGSFVSAGNTPIIVGAGGGGFYTVLSGVTPNTDGSYTQNGQNATDGTGNGGSGGGGGTGSNAGWGGGGGGFSTNGTAAINCVGTAGSSFLSGGAGGGTCNNTVGGFGGGGGTHGNSGGGGGGGGYSGGGGSQQLNAGTNGGGGGGSYQMPGMTNNSDLGFNLGDGYVNITKLCSVNISASTNPICIGQSVTLTTDAVSGITWSGSGSTANSIVVSPNTTTSYSVTGTSTANCVSGALVTIVVNPLPVLAAVVTPTTLCVGKTATISAFGAATYTWNGGPTGSSLMVNPGVNTTYNLTGASQFGCLSSGTIAVNVNTNNITVTPAVTVCKGNPLDLSATGAITYTWSSGSNFSTAHVTPVSNVTYTVSGIDMYGCNLSNMVAVTVNSSPTVVTSSNKSNICKNESVSLSAQGANTYTWSNGSIGTPVNLNLAVDVLYTYTVTGEDNNGCLGTSVISISVNKCTGISGFSAAGLEANVYPNPASSLLTVELNNSSVKFIEVIDLTGRIVLSKTGSSEKTDMDVTGLANGIYYVKLSSENKSEVFKIVKSN